MIFSTKRDELGNVSGFVVPNGQLKASVEAKKAQIDTDVVGLNRVLQNTGGDTKPLSLDDLIKRNPPQKFFSENWPEIASF